jgi:predicted CopG family antitoxin
VAVKTLTITEEAYLRLKSQKTGSESFSELIMRLTSRAPLAAFSGVLAGEPGERLRQAIESDRRIRAKLDREHAPRYKLPR